MSFLSNMLFQFVVHYSNRRTTHANPIQLSKLSLPVCHDGVRNCDRRDEAEGGGCGPRDSSADIRFITDGSGPDGLAWWSPASKSPERPMRNMEKQWCNENILVNILLPHTHQHTHQKHILFIGDIKSTGALIPSKFYNKNENLTIPVSLNLVTMSFHMIKFTSWSKYFGRVLM